MFSTLHEIFLGKNYFYNECFRTHFWKPCFLDSNSFVVVFFLEAGSYEMTNQHVKQNGKLEDNPSSGSPPRTTLLGTIFSPVFNFFSPANKNGKYKPLIIICV